MQQSGSFRFATILIFCVFMAVAGCVHWRQVDRVPKPGHPMPEGTSPVAMVHKGGILCSHGIVADGVTYNFDVECGRNVILYVQTLDPLFATPEGLSIGMTLRNALRVGGVFATDGGCGVRLPSGWIARPPMGLETAGWTRRDCSTLVDEPIRFFDMGD